MSTALVTGANDRTSPVASALRTEGFETLAVDQGALDGVPLGPGSVNCYVQLPGVLPAGGIHPPALVARVDAVAAVSPFLADRAAVLLVADDLGWDQRRRDALALLTEAALADHGPGVVRVAVLGEQVSPGDIVERVRAVVPSLADLAPDLGYADWRDEVLNMTGTAGRTYFGWTDGDGRSCAAVLKGTVMSPLRRPSSGAHTSPVFSWGGTDPGAHRLAQALLADAVGADSRCAGCAGVGGECPACGGDGLTGWARDLAGAFVDEVVASFPPEGFELRVADVAAWLSRYASR
ncbi:MAG: hypothetical protein M3357_03610 [Actinomycetota bacterium]|nr:hypothetical protein [Actinomycetota bacterium]